MIMTTLARNLDTLWAESQLNDQLQQIFSKYCKHFDGTSVDPAT